MGDLLCSLVEPSGCNHPIAVTISNEGFILANYADKKGVLALFSINGNYFKSVTLEEQVLVSVDILTVSSIPTVLLSLHTLYRSPSYL